MKRENNDPPKDIDSLLAELRNEVPKAPAHLMERVLEDARALQPQLKPASQPQGFLSRLRKIGPVWSPVAGLVAASCVGFWIGFNPPEGVVEAAGLLNVSGWDTYDTAEISGFGWDMLEDQ